MQRPLYIDNRSVGVTSKGIVGLRSVGVPAVSPMLPAGEGYSGSLFEDVGDYFTGATARKEAARYKRRKDKAIQESRLALIEASKYGTEVEGPGIMQWILLLTIGGGLMWALSR